MEPKKEDTVYNQLFRELEQYRTEERKLEHLENLLKKNPDQETRKTAFVIMAALQSYKMWYNSAAKSYHNAADLAKTFSEKIDLLLKAITLFVTARDYKTAEEVTRQAVVLASSKDKDSIRSHLINTYLKQADQYEANKMFNKTIKVLSRLLNLKIDNEQKKSVLERLVYLYEKIGNPIEANKIRQQMR
ncbi:MAG: hypothetical protein JSW08_00355 [archaeon]|nr:MAG: hypothetical protein JSW08_00355 [archaeon]